MEFECGIVYVITGPEMSGKSQLARTAPLPHTIINGRDLTERTNLSELIRPESRTLIVEDVNIFNSPVARFFAQFVANDQTIVEVIGLPPREQPTPIVIVCAREVVSYPSPRIRITRTPTTE